MKKKLGVGIIGLGHNGEAHLRAYQSNPFTEVVAVCDLSEEKVQRLKEKYGIKYGYTNYRILERDDIEIISVNTPDHLHAEPFIKSLEAGKHTFVEKPMADDISDLKRMVETADKNPHLKTLVGHILRFNPLFQEIKRIIKKGTLGRIFYVEGDYIHNLKCQADKERYNKKIKMNWYLEKELPIVGGGSHPLDLLRWFAQDEPVEVQAYSNHITFQEMKNDSSVVAIFKFRDGAIGKVTALYEPVAPYAYANNIAVYGTKGTIIKDMICLDEREGFTKIETAYSRAHPYEPEVNYFVDCILKDEKPLIDAREGARSAAAVITVSEALKEKKSVPIPQF